MKLLLYKLRFPIILIVSLLIVWLIIGCAHQPQTKPEQMQAWCEEAYDIHRVYADNPVYCNKQVGSQKWHEEWCNRYDQMIQHFEQEAFKRRVEP